LINRRRHSSILDEPSFRGAEADCDTDHYLVVAKVQERLAVSKKQHRSFMGKDLSSRSKMSWRLGKSIRMWRTSVMMRT